MLCLRAGDTAVIFISIEGVQILALGWLRNDSVSTGTKSSCRGSRPHLTGVSPVLTHHTWVLERRLQEQPNCPGCVCIGLGTTLETPCVTLQEGTGI